jgi:acyl-CoA synthetase (AMP-forming)/AMP-acid ligase II/acetyltransferase-like isoleucine patch superfamily enzyme/acyl carrier protein
VIRANAAVDEGPDFLRLIFSDAEDRVLSYRELVAEAERWSSFYAGHGLGPRDRVIVILPHSPDLYGAYLGALLGGQVPAMFAFPSPKFSEQEYFRNVGTLIETAHSRMLITYPELAEKLARRRRAALGSAQLVTPDALSGRDGPSPPAAEPRRDDVAFLQYSSGTTGIKKGVAVSHRALLWQVGAYASEIGAGPGDRIVSWLPLYHDMGLITCLFLPLLRRIPLVAMSPFDWVRSPSMWTDAVTEHGGTLSWLPNFAYSFMAANVRGDALDCADLSSLRGVVNCSEPIMATSHKAFLDTFGERGAAGSQLAVSYAMAENTFAVTSGGFGRPAVVESVDGDVFDREHRAEPVAPGSPGERVLVGSGRLLPEHELTIVGRDGEPLPQRHVGEITLRSPCLMSGYDHNPSVTAEAMRGGRYYTGDLGFLADGELFVTGRVRDLIIVGGRNIYPQDVEQVVESVTGVVPGRVVAVGIADPQLGTERLAVLAETTATDPARRKALQQAIHAAVAESTEVVPQVVQVLDQRSLLKSSSGKPARAANRERFLSDAAPRAPGAVEPAPTAPAGVDLHGTTRRVVEAILGGPIDDRTTLISSGRFDSFALAELFGALEADTGVSIPSSARGEAERFDTIAAIADTLAEISAGTVARAATAEGASVLDADAIPMRYGGRAAPRRARGAWTRYYQTLFRLRGIHCGPGLRVLGPILLQIDGRPENIEIGADVTLMPGAHLKNRENGRIMLHDGVKLDTMARLVAANDARLELGENVAIGMGTVVNAGVDVLIGRGCLTAAHCVINASDHGTAPDAPIQRQAFEHAPIYIGEDVWLGAGVTVSKGSWIGSGAVVSAGSTVSGPVPGAAIVHGNPARPVKYRR